MPRATLVLSQLHNSTQSCGRVILSFSCDHVDHPFKTTFVSFSFLDCGFYYYDNDIMKEEGDEESLADSLIEGNKVRNQPFFSDPPKYNSRRRSSPPVPFVVYAIVLLISLTVNLFGAVFALYGWNPFPSSSSSSSPSSTTTSQNDNLPASPYSMHATNTVILPFLSLTVSYQVDSSSTHRRYITTRPTTGAPT